MGKPMKTYYWTIDDVPACDSPLAPPGSSCAFTDKDEARRWADVVLKEHPGAKIAFVDGPCPQPQRSDEWYEDPPPLPEKGGCIQRMLDLSSGHVPESQVDAFDVGELRWSAHEYGWVVWPMHDAEVPDWFRPIHELALNASCLLINFDRDGDEDATLPTYEW